MEPDKVVERQLTAYNNRDIDKYSRLFDIDVEAYNLSTGDLIFQGKEDLIKVYSNRFANSPELHSELINRICVGDFVIDNERIRGYNGNEEVRIVAIYEVRNRLITRMWFIRGQEQEEIVEAVDIQLQGYNQRDIDLFISAYSFECKIYDLASGNLRMDGSADMRQRYTDLFADSSNLHAEVLQRMYLDKYVIDHEKVTGFRGVGNVNAVAIYEVIDSKIHRVWFLR